jgi:hypothetical protein
LKLFYYFYETLVSQNQALAIISETLVSQNQALAMAIDANNEAGPKNSVISSQFKE